MKVNGIPLSGMIINEVFLPIKGGDVCFKFRPLKADEDFENVMPKPNAPKKMAPGGVVHLDKEDKSYKEALAIWVKSKLNWEFLQSISATEGLEWSKVDLSKPETWHLWKEELEEHFGQFAIDKIFGGFLDVHYISEETMEKSRARFLTGIQGTQESPHFQTGDQANTQSGEPASV